MDAIIEASHLTIIAIEGEIHYARLLGVSTEREMQSEFVQKCGDLSFTVLPSLSHRNPFGIKEPGPFRPLLSYVNVFAR